MSNGFQFIVLFFLILFAKSIESQNTTALSLGSADGGSKTDLLQSGYITILVTRHNSPTCSGNPTERMMCKYVHYTEMNYCNPPLFQMWSWNGNGLQLTVFYDPLCKMVRYTQIYRAGCSNSVLTQLLDDYQCSYRISQIKEFVESVESVESVGTMGVLVFLIGLLILTIIVWFIWKKYRRVAPEEMPLLPTV
jgi:Na+-transporting methylmalonyl-CoA/oxaloacetate decarboxylase gamma subunit